MVVVGAATALAYGRPVLTANPRDFARVPGLTVHQLAGQ
jgi:predicted nucleic acid-binding protein